MPTACSIPFKSKNPEGRKKKPHPKQKPPLKVWGKTFVSPFYLGDGMCTTTVMPIFRKCQRGSQHPRWASRMVSVAQGAILVVQIIPFILPALDKEKKNK